MFLLSYNIDKSRYKKIKSRNSKDLIERVGSPNLIVNKGLELHQINIKGAILLFFITSSHSLSNKNIEKAQRFKQDMAPKSDK